MTNLDPNLAAAAAGERTYVLAGRTRTLHLGEAVEVQDIEAGGRWRPAKVTALGIRTVTVEFTQPGRGPATAQVNMKVSGSVKALDFDKIRVAAPLKAVKR